MRQKRKSDPIRIIRPMVLAERLGIDHSTLWRWEQDGHIPPATQISPGVRGWPEREIRRWLRSRPKSGEANQSV